MSIPLNGRVAIIDNEIDEVLPLMKVFAKHQIPYVFYQGDNIEFLPEKNTAPNDIRLLFLDLNLLSKSTLPTRQVQSTLFSVIKRVISKDNFPYTVIVWSTQENEYLGILNDLFQHELKDRAPIAIIPFIKSDFFPTIPGAEIPTTAFLFDSIKEKIGKNPEYSNLLKWENLVHQASDNTLQEIFSPYHSLNDWQNNAAYILKKLSESYSGSKNFKALNTQLKTINSFQAFNSVFTDTLEFNSNKCTIEDLIDFENIKIDTNTVSIGNINTKLLIAKEQGNMEYSGAITQDTNDCSEPVFSDLLSNIVDRRSFLSTIADEENKTDDEKSELRKAVEKEVNKQAKAKRTQIRETWKKIYCVVTPLCDVVQNKNKVVRVVKGVLIKSEYLDVIDSKSEAIFISPKFSYDNESYIIVLHFGYFFTSPGAKKFVGLKPLFRLRQPIVAEIQSKLARHVSRQGVLFLD